MVSARPEKEMEEVLGKGEGEYTMLAEVERLLKDLLKYKEVLVTAMEGANNRMDVVEKKVDVFSRDKQNAESKALELLKNGQEEITHKLLENIKPFEKNIEEISKSQKEDNKFMGGFYNEFKDSSSINDNQIREINKELAKTKAELEKAQAFKKALGDFIRAVIE